MDKIEQLQAAGFDVENMTTEECLAVLEDLEFDPIDDDEL